VLAGAAASSADLTSRALVRDAYPAVGNVSDCQRCGPAICGR